MKKVIPLICALTLVGSPLTGQVFADGVNPTEDESVEEVEQPEGEAPAEEIPELETLTTLTLEEVITRGIENNKNLTVLKLQLDQSESQFLNTEYDKKQLEKDIRDIERKLKDLKREKDNLDNVAAKMGNFQERKAYMDSLEQLEDAIPTLELALKQLKSGELQLTMQQEEAKEGVRLLLTSSYAKLLLQDQQIDNTQIALETAASK